MAIIRPVYVINTTQLEEQIQRRASVICVVNPALIQPLKAEIKEGTATYARNKKIGKRMIKLGATALVGGGLGAIFSPFLVAGAAISTLGFFSATIGAGDMISNSISHALKSKIKYYTWVDASVPDCLMLLRTKRPNAYHPQTDTIDDSELMDALEAVKASSIDSAEIKKPIFDVHHAGYHILFAYLEKRFHLYVNGLESACCPNFPKDSLCAKVDGNLICVKHKDAITWQLLFNDHEIAYRSSYAFISDFGSTK